MLTIRTWPGDSIDIEDFSDPTKTLRFQVYLNKETGELTFLFDDPTYAFRIERLQRKKARLKREADDGRAPAGRLGSGG